MYKENDDLIMFFVPDAKRIFRYFGKKGRHRAVEVQAQQKTNRGAYNAAVLKLAEQLAAFPLPSDL